MLDVAMMEGDLSTYRVLADIRLTSVSSGRSIRDPEALFKARAFCLASIASGFRSGAGKEVIYGEETTSACSERRLMFRRLFHYLPARNKLYVSHKPHSATTARFKK
ncbi:unnamed protein product [Scytosiphon promiscuus]